MRGRERGRGIGERGKRKGKRGVTSSRATKADWREASAMRESNALVC
jgi:hypothetical protein